MDKYCYRIEDGEKFLYFDSSIDDRPDWYNKYFSRDVELARKTMKDVVGTFYVFCNINAIRAVIVMEKNTFHRKYSLDPVDINSNL